LAMELMLGLVFACVLFFQSSAALAAEAKENKKAGKTIVLIGHRPDHPKGTHVYLPTCQLLAKCLRQTKGVEAVVSDGWPKDQALLDRADALVLYTGPGAELCLKGPQAAQFQKMMKRGVGLVAIHWATAVHKKNQKEIGDKYQHALGGIWIHFSGIKIADAMLEQLDKDHPICRGWKDYKLNDEYYLNPVIAKHGKALLGVQLDGKPLVVGWVGHRETKGPDSKNGRSFGTTLGHFWRNFGIKSFRQMMINGILWTSHVQIPKDGASCQLSEEDKKLPGKAR